MRQPGSMVLALSAATAIICCANGVVGTAIISRGAVLAGFAFNGMWAVVFLGCSYSLVPAELATGLAISMLGSYMAHTIWQSLYLRHLLRHVPAEP